MLFFIASIVLKRVSVVFMLASFTVFWFLYCIYFVLVSKLDVELKICRIIICLKYL